MECAIIISSYSSMVVGGRTDVYTIHKTYSLFVQNQTQREWLT